MFVFYTDSPPASSALRTSGWVHLKCDNKFFRLLISTSDNFFGWYFRYSVLAFYATCCAKLYLHFQRVLHHWKLNYCQAASSARALKTHRVMNFQSWFYIFKIIHICRYKLQIINYRCYENNRIREFNFVLRIEITFSIISVFKLITGKYLHSLSTVCFSKLFSNLNPKTSI